MGSKMNIYYDEEGDFLEVTNGDISNCYFDNLGDGICQEPPVKDWWHDNATLRVVLEHAQNSTSNSNHKSKTYGILTFKTTGYKP